MVSYIVFKNWTKYRILSRESFTFNRTYSWKKFQLFRDLISRVKIVFWTPPSLLLNKTPWLFYSHFDLVCRSHLTHSVSFFTSVVTLSYSATYDILPCSERRFIRLYDNFPKIHSLFSYYFKIESFVMKLPPYSYPNLLSHSPMLLWSVR